MGVLVDLRMHEGLQERKWVLLLGDVFFPVFFLYCVLLIRTLHKIIGLI